jgi:transposase
MIGKDKEAEIIRLFHGEKWLVGTIASQLGVHHSTVSRVLEQSGAKQEDVHPRASIADTYVPFVIQTLEKYPGLCASRLFAMVKERGYAGGPDHFRKIVARHRPRKPAEAYQRLSTLPGEQGQVDWAHFGKIQIGSATRALYAFVMVLAWSREIFLRFYLSSRMGSFLAGHVAAFEHFRGVPRVLLYDNLKSAVLERVGSAIRFHPTLLELSRHYRFEPRPVAPARGNEKGRVERAIRYIRTSFFAARTFDDIVHLNHQAVEWMATTADDRLWQEDRGRTVRQAFEQETALLLPLPDDAFPAVEREDVEIGKTPYARFDGNDYSVPADYTRRTLVVVATEDTIELSDGQHVVAAHVRSWDRGRQIEDPAHVAALIERKALARRHRGLNRLTQAAPSSRRFIEMAAAQGHNLGSTTARLLALLDAHTAEQVDAAIAEAVEHETIHLGAVRQLLDRNRAARGKPPPIAMRVTNERYAGLTIRPAKLATYDTLIQENDDEP